MGLVGLTQFTLVMKLSSQFGPLVLTVNRMVSNLVQWTLMIAFVVGAFALALFTYLGQVDVLAECADLPESALGESLFGASFYLFRIAIKYGPRANVDCFEASPYVAVVMFTYDMLSALMLFKMLTAFMTHAFHDVWDHSAVNHQMNLAQLTLTWHAAAAAPPPLSAVVRVRELASRAWSGMVRLGCMERLGYKQLDEPKEQPIKPHTSTEKLLDMIKDTIMDERAPEVKRHTELKEKFETELKVIKDELKELKDLLRPRKLRP